MADILQIAHLALENFCILSRILLKFISLGSNWQEVYIGDELSSEQNGRYFACDISLITFLQNDFL